MMTKARAEKHNYIKTIKSDEKNIGPSPTLRASSRRLLIPESSTVSIPILHHASLHLPLFLSRLKNTVISALFPGSATAKEKIPCSQIQPVSGTAPVRSSDIRATRVIWLVDSAPGCSLQGSRLENMFSFKSSIRSSSGAKDASKPRFMEESDTQEQLYKLQEELTKDKQEKMRALDEVEDLKKNKSRTKKLKSNGREDQLDLADRLQQLEGELEAARDSERKLLVSLEAQTKQLEQTKVALEEAKLEITSLRDDKKSLEAVTALSSNPSSEPVKNFRRRGMMSFSFASPGEVETWSLQRELKLALESEEKCKKAMDELAIALKEQTTEAREAKTKLSLVQAELDNAKTEAEDLKATLAITEEKLRTALEEAGRLKVESDELAAASKEKERGLIDCIKMFEGELTKGKEENDMLIESQRVIRDENSRLREMLKHAVGEANVARESLEIARVENSRLNEHISEQESTLKSMMHEYESVKVSEAAAQSSIKELKDMIDAMFSSESTKTSAEASPQDMKRAVIPERSVAEDDVYSDVDIRNPAKQKKKTILRKFSDIMKKRNSQNAI